MIVKISTIVLLSIGVPSIIYLLILPHFFASHRTYIFLALGSIFGGLGVGYVIYKNINCDFLLKLVGSIASGIAGGIIIFLAIIFIVVNTQGS
jgi:hypothetical protein